MTEQSTATDAGQSPSAGVQVRDHGSMSHRVKVSGPEGAPVEVSRSRGVLATAKDDRMGGLGRHGMSEDHTRVMVGKVEMSLGEAVQWGRVIKNADGTYRDVTAEDVAANDAAADHQESLSEDPDDISVGLDDHGTAVVSHMASAVKAEGYSVASVVNELLSNPNKLPAGLARAAIKGGHDLKETETEVWQIVDSYERFIAQKLTEVVGMPADRLGAFFKWAGEPQRSSLRMSAILELLHTGSLRPFLSLGREYMTTNSIGSDRKVKLNGMTTTEAAARRAGMI